MLAAIRCLARCACVFLVMLAASLPIVAVSGEDKTIVFVCLHGVVNSQIAAAYFNKVAKDRGLPFTAVSRGIDLYKSVPVRIQDGLALDGLEPANAPFELTAEEGGRANRVLAFDTIPADRKGRANVTYWSGVPIGIDDYEKTRDEIARRIDAMIPTLVKETAK
jgi:arsenate reductase (thioredoxin)